MAPQTGKNKKKKWSKGKVKDKADNSVFVDEASLAKVVKEVATYKLITPSVICDRHRLNVSLARQILTRIEEQGLIRLVSKHSRQLIYTRAVATE